MANPEQGLVLDIDALGVEVTGQVVGASYSVSVMSDLVAHTLNAWRTAYDHIYPDGQPLADDVEADILAALDDTDD